MPLAACVRLSATAVAWIRGADVSPGSLRSPGAINSAATAAEQLLNLSAYKLDVNPVSSK